MADPPLEVQPVGPAVASTATEVPAGPLVRAVIVDPAISSAKLDAELADWQSLAATYAATRHAYLLGVTGVQVDVGFAVPLLGMPSAIPPGGPGVAAVIAVAIRLDYTNYDLEPPSLTFIDPLTRAPGSPIVPGLEVHEGGVRNIVLGEHPVTHLPFLCQPGVAEYHVHPQHDDDSWLAKHRDLGSGRLANIIDRVWQAMTRYATVTVQVQLQNLQLPFPMLRVAHADELFTDAGVGAPGNNAIAPG